MNSGKTLRCRGLVENPISEKGVERIVKGSFAGGILQKLGRRNKRDPFVDHYFTGKMVECSLCKEGQPQWKGSKISLRGRIDHEWIYSSGEPEGLKVPGLAAESKEASPALGNHR